MSSLNSGLKSQKWLLLFFFPSTIFCQRGHKRKSCQNPSIVFICFKSRTRAHKRTLTLPYVLGFTTSPPHSSPSALIPGRGSSPRCLCLNSRDSGIIQTFHGTYLCPLWRRRRRWKTPPRSRSLHCPPLFNQALSVARVATVVCCLSLGKCRPKWLLCAEAQTARDPEGCRRRPLRQSRVSRRLTRTEWGPGAGRGPQSRRCVYFSCLAGALIRKASAMLLALVASHSEIQTVVRSEGAPAQKGEHQSATQAAGVAQTPMWRLWKVCREGVSCPFVNKRRKQRPCVSPNLRKKEVSSECDLRVQPLRQLYFWDWLGGQPGHRTVGLPSARHDAPSGQVYKDWVESRWFILAYI